MRAAEPIRHAREPLTARFALAFTLAACAASEAPRDRGAHVTAPAPRAAGITVEAPKAEPPLDAGASEPAPEPTAEAPAELTAPLFVPQPIEDASGTALQGFHAALARAETGQGAARLVFYGASHVASDLYTEVVRARLAARFGDAGIGFVLPAKPFAGYRNAGIEIERSSGFRGAHVKARAPIGARYGLAGVYLRNRNDGVAVTALRARGPASQLELYYDEQPRGGGLRIAVGGSVHEVTTRGPEERAGYARFELPEGARRIALETLGDGPVRLYGVALERADPGVIVDTLGIPGARARYHLLWDDALYREHLARRKPDLVVLAYGTNEAGDDDVPIRSYEGDLRRVVQRLREVAPQASCLLIGPSDRPMKDGDGIYADRPRTAQIVEAQRGVARDLGCGFFDLVAFMGGPLAMTRWVLATPPLATRDHVHFTRAGYQALGAALYESLVAGYREPGPPSEQRASLSATPDSPRSP